MQTLETIYRRRSIRHYTDASVSNELILKIIKAGMQAPSAHNEQPWHFVIITDKAALNEIPSFSPYAAMTKEAAAGIIVCADLGLLKREGYWPQDCAACVQNMLLTAADFGLGAVWTAIYPDQEKIDGYRTRFSLPDVIMPFAFIPIGYPDEEPVARDNYHADRVHYEKW